MNFLDKMKAIAAEAKKVKESMTIVDPRRTAVDMGVGRDERLVRSSGVTHQRRVAECAKLLADVIGGRRDPYFLKEAMTTSDFPNLMGDVLYRQLLGNYEPYPVSYPAWTRIMEVKDFRALNLYTIDGGQGILSEVKERAPYPEIAFSENKYSVQVAKYGRRYGISFEMIVNDDLNAFSQRPMMMSTGARRSEEYLATGMLCGAGGPDSSFFAAGNDNIVTGNPILSIQGLQTAYSVLAAQTDADGQPIIISGVKLVVPPALEVTANNIMNATQIRINGSGGTPPGGGSMDQFLYAANWMSKKVQLSVNPYLPVINTTSGNTAWYLIADPNDQMSRPAFVFAFLRGRRNPQLFVKDSNQRSLGGGDVDVLEGDFDTDAIDYKLRHFFGATQVDPKMAVASDGTEVA